MNVPSLAPATGDLLFRWERPRQRRYAIAGFLLASAGLHALCFYLFQVVYPPTISLLPPPAQVSVIAPTTEEARNFLNWLESEDPALASQTQRPADARAFQLPKLAHIPSYLAVPPTLKMPPAAPLAPAAPSALPPAPVPLAPAPKPPPPVLAPTTLVFSDQLGGRTVTHPELKFRASSREAPQSARFRVAADSLGVIRYRFLEQSSGDPALDEEARAALALTRLSRMPRPNADAELTWATAIFEFGNDLELPPTPAEHAP